AVAVLELLARAAWAGGIARHPDKQLRIDRGEAWIGRRARAGKGRRSATGKRAARPRAEEAGQAVGDFIVAGIGVEVNLAHRQFRRRLGPAQLHVDMAELA